MKRSILWFRNDLRLHDNEALLDAIKHNDEIIPLFIIDPRIFKGKTRFGFRKSHRHRSQFILDGLHDLRDKLKALNSNLYIREGYPEEIIPAIARHCKTSYIYCNRERTEEEVSVQDKLEQNLWSIGQEIRYFRGKMLYYTADLPFPITHCPDQFANFRKEVERFVSVRTPLENPHNNLTALTPELEEGQIPVISDFGFENHETDKGEKFKGGEGAALAHLNYYLWESDSIKNYKEAKNGLSGRNFSSKLGPYLSNGCLSPKSVYHEIQKYENERGANDSTYELKFELLWRDFFRFMGKKHGNKIFQLSGTKGQNPEYHLVNPTIFNKWKSGKTGVPLIDASMNELNETGFLSNRARQLVASFLVKDMKINWLMGAEYFESMLIDYDPCSNYGNWNYVAGVGVDSREDRYFNIPSQAKKYDPEAKYIKYWLPELKNIDAELLFNPFNIESSETLSKNYIQPCVHIKNW